MHSAGDGNSWRAGRQEEAPEEETCRSALVPGAGGVVCSEDGWKMLHLLAYLAEMTAQNSLLPSVVVCGLWEERLLREKKGADAIKQTGSGSRSDMLQTVLGLGSQQVDSDGCLGAEEARAFYSAVASPEPLKVSGILNTCLLRYWMQQAWKLYCRNEVAACHPNFHVSTDILSRETAGGNSLGGPLGYVESNLLHTERWKPQNYRNLQSQEEKLKPLLSFLPNGCYSAAEDTQSHTAPADILGHGCSLSTTAISQTADVNATSPLSPLHYPFF
ncbi:hypothetical protein IHE44_0000925 [Lamprotornis superbus]|uniref:Uncharacterized protein n=1 Tax=Lamprotornis superbus TaxID=245042 RepID=A0A835TXZ0_9PASS|nr:hypothetical protein IHE44_0000925 [Lamprotornis superbus]